MADHDWGMVPNQPWVDASQCRRCGLQASNASIASGVDTQTHEPLPPCEGRPMADHKWIGLPNAMDGAQCVVCGMIASSTAIASGAGVPTTLGWVMGEMASALPQCEEVDLDTEFAKVLAGEL